MIPRQAKKDLLLELSAFYWPDRQFNVFEHGKIVDVISGIQKLSMVKYLIGRRPPYLPMNFLPLPTSYQYRG